jgi:hypothetical protein
VKWLNYLPIRAWRLPLELVKKEDEDKNGERIIQRVRAHRSNERAGPVFDQMTGTLLVYAILAALVARDKQGLGQQVEVSLLGSEIHLQAYNRNTALLRGRQIPRPSRRSLKNPMANHFECSDGEWLLLSEPQADRFWPAFYDALGIQHLEKDEKYADAARRRENYQIRLAEVRKHSALAPAGRGRDNEHTMKTSRIPLPGFPLSCILV